VLSRFPNGRSGSSLWSLRKLSYCLTRGCTLGRDLSEEEIVAAWQPGVVERALRLPALVTRFGGNFAKDGAYTFDGIQEDVNCHFADVGQHSNKHVEPLPDFGF
jgi:hypothetical protein